MLKKLDRVTASLPRNKPVKVLQFGKGNFLRAFAEWMIDIMNEKAGFNGAVQIVQVNSTGDDARFSAQDNLYHVVINGIQDGKVFREVRLISAVDSIVNPFADYNAYLRAAENPDLQVIISNTTEAGIVFDSTDADAGTLAKTFPGKLTALLYHRFRFFNGDPLKAPAVLPCELIERNGEVLRDAICRYIAHWKLPKDFERWITDHMGFFNTLVDRIVPGFPKENTEAIWEETGYKDELVVMAEPYHIWVIQPVRPEVFPTERLNAIFPLERAGFDVIFTDDLTPYRTRKVRILNGAHTAMVPVAWLKGIRTVKDAVDDAAMGKFIREAIDEEIIPTLDRPKEELVKFASDVIERFQNPFIRHELASIALNCVSKFQVRVLPSILEFHHRTGRLPEKLLQSLAALILFYRGEWNGEATPLKDTPEVLAAFREAWSNNNVASAVERVLSNEALWKTDLSKIEGLADSVKRMAESMQKPA